MFDKAGWAQLLVPVDCVFLLGKGLVDKCPAVLTLGAPAIPPLLLFSSLRPPLEAESEAAGADKALSFQASMIWAQEFRVGESDRRPGPSGHKHLPCRTGSTVDLT